jgi:hypothetical protein
LLADNDETFSVIDRHQRLLYFGRKCQSVKGATVVELAGPEKEVEKGFEFRSRLEPSDLRYAHFL